MEVSQESARRLWASLQADNLQDRTDGFEAGKEWAAERAEARELQRLTRWFGRLGGDESIAFFTERDESRESSISDDLAGIATGDIETNCAEFWEAATGVDLNREVDERLDSPAWLSGFVDGAVSYWKAAIPRINQKVEMASA